MRLVNVYTLVTFCLTLNGCFKMDVVHSGRDSVRGKTSKTSLVQAITSETGAITAAFSAQSTTTQVLTAASETMSGTVLALPPGTLSIDTSISIEESAPIATETMGAELGINAVMQQTGTAVSVQTDVPMDAKQPFTLSMPLPVLGLTGDDKWTNLIVIYKVKIAADGLTVAGVIPRSDIVVENNVAKINVMNFGAFQTALTNVPVVEKKQVETKSEIVTKQQVIQLPPLSVTSRVPFVAKENQTVTISGSNFRPGLMLALGGKKVGDLKVLSDSKASFIAPKVESLGLTKLTAEQDGVSQSVSMFYTGTGDLPLITEAESEVCAGKKYYNANGEVKVGTKVCPSAAELANITPANLKSGVVVMGVTGTMLAGPAACASDGESNCVASASYPAVNKAAVNPAQILSGASVAGVSGTYVAPTTTPLADCASDGETNCKANSSFKAIAISTLSSKMPNIRTSVTIAGLSGSLADCSADGISGCVATSSFPSMQTSGAAAKIASGQTLGSVVGSAGVRPPDCAVDGDVGCVTVSNFPAIDKVSKLSVANAAKIRSTLTIAGVAGTLADCVSDGDSGCVVLGPTYAAALLSGADAKIILGQQLAGVTGNAAVRPADCSADGGIDCVAVNNFPAVDKINNLGAAKLAKIHSSLTVAGLAGTLANCGADGQTNCLTISSFPAVDMAILTAGNIKKNVMIAGVNGQYPSISFPLTGADSTPDLDIASFNAKIKSSGSFEYFSADGSRHLGNGSSNLTPANIRNNISFFGDTGTFAPDCAGDGVTGCLAVSGFPAANIAGINTMDIRAGKTIAGVNGSLFFPGNGAYLTLHNRTAGTGNNPSTSQADLYDSIDDFGNGTSFPNMFPPGWPMVSPSNWAREAGTDVGTGGGTATNGFCDGTEICIWIDKLSGRQWLKPTTSGYSWENAINYCDSLVSGPYSDYRLPTQKELMQAYISGIWSINTNLQMTGTPLYWSTTSDSTNATSNAYAVEVAKGLSTSVSKGVTQFVMCVR